MTTRKAILLSTAAMFFATQAFAQNATSSPAVPQEPAGEGSTDAPVADTAQTGIQEVVVTAQRREENLQRVPISVSAFGAKEIQEKGLTDMSRLEGLVPGFTFGRSGVEARPAIRGVRTESVGTNSDTVIGFFIDGIYQSRTSQGTTGFVDLERIEVQRGPQGTLFGRNTLGGNISVITAQPKLNQSLGGAARSKCS